MEINIQEWDQIKPDQISEKSKIELSLIDIYNKLEMQVPKNHQEILDDIYHKLRKENTCWPLSKLSK